LRVLQRHLPDLPAAGRRTGRAARPHLSDQAGAGRQDRDRAHAAASGPVPDVPQLRNHLSVGRAVRSPGRYRPPPGRAAGCAAAGRPYAAGHLARGADRLVVRTDAEAGPGVPQLAAAADPQLGAAAARCGPLADAQARPANVADDRMRAAGASAYDRFGHRPRVRRRRHRDQSRSRPRVLRGDPAPSGRPAGRAARGPRQHRRPGGPRSNRANARRWS